MREWRKLYKSLSTSAKASTVSDQALVLYVLVLAHQDDLGRIPWNPPFARAITAIREWVWDEVQKMADELCNSTLTYVEGGFLYVVKGKELNGNPRPDKRPAMLYPETVPVPSLSCPETDPVPLRGEERRVEESREDKSTPLWTSPEWFAPLKELSGYKNKNHSRAAAGIEAACLESEVSPTDVVKTFAATWPTLKIKYRWHDPVATLKGKPLEIAIEHVRNRQTATPTTVEAKEDPLASYRRDAAFLASVPKPRPGRYAMPDVPLPIAESS